MMIEAAVFVMMAVPGAGSGDPVRIDLRREARVFATHATPADEFKIENAVDGDHATKWVGEGHPLTLQPTSVVLEFSEPRPVARLVLVSQVHRDRLALKDFEVYAWGRDSWAGAEPLAVLRATEVRTVVDFPPVKTRRLRIRIRDTWRDDHAFPRLEEIEAYAAPGPGARELADSPVPGEGKSERLVLRRALGERIEFPGEPFDPARGWLGYARAFLDTMIAEGTDVYGPVRSPLFASLLDMETHRIPDEVPSPVPGQRQGDRAVRGGNLFHDVMLLRAADLVSELTGDPKYRAAATAYLRFFLSTCRTPTGLFPWGEHAHWDFFREAPGSTVHEHLGGPPRAFWERLWEIDPAALRGEGDGLMNHVLDLETFDYDRHADIEKPLPVPRPPAGRGFMDFPRHAGFYVGLWTFLHARSGEPRFLDRALRMADRLDRKRDPRSGLPPASVREPGTASVESALSAAISLLEAASLLPAGDARVRLERPARAMVDAIVRLPHRPDEGKLVDAAPIDGRDAAAKAAFTQPYVYGYGGGFTADDAVLLLAAHRLAGDARALALARGVAGFYARHEPPPAWEIVRAHVYASILELFSGLYELEGRPEDLAQAERHARLAIERLFRGGLFRGATGIDHYEGDLMVSNLVYGLVRLHVLAAKSKVEAPLNAFNR